MLKPIEHHLNSTETTDNQHTYNVEDPLPEHVGRVKDFLCDAKSTQYIIENNKDISTFHDMPTQEHTDIILQ